MNQEEFIDLQFVLIVEFEKGTVVEIWDELSTAKQQATKYAKQTNAHRIIIGEIKEILEK